MSLVKFGMFQYWIGNRVTHVIIHVSWYGLGSGVINVSKKGYMLIFGIQRRY
jgi:hypothetical protein